MLWAQFFLLSYQAPTKPATDEHSIFLLNFDRRGCSMFMNFLGKFKSVILFLLSQLLYIIWQTIKRFSGNGWHNCMSTNNYWYWWKGKWNSIPFFVGWFIRLETKSSFGVRRWAYEMQLYFWFFKQQTPFVFVRTEYCKSHPLRRNSMKFQTQQDIFVKQLRKIFLYFIWKWFLFRPNVKSLLITGWIDNKNKYLP